VSYLAGVECQVTNDERRHNRAQHGVQQNRTMYHNILLVETSSSSRILKSITHLKLSKNLF
jgi:hypothetical protein